MTDDIVTRLRDCAWVRPESEWATKDDKTIAEAADEMEQLLKDVKYQARVIGRHYDQFKKMEDEIERLRKELSEWKALANTPQSSLAPRMTCIEHGQKFMCWDDYMGGVFWCEECKHG